MSTALREQNYGQIQGLTDDRPRDWFDYACALACVAITVATVAFIYWSK